MKKITLLLSTCLLGIVSFGQSALSLDDWTNVGTDNEQATGWSIPLNLPGAASLLGDTSVTRVAGFSGFAAKLAPVDLAAAGAPGFYFSQMDLGTEGMGVPNSNLLASFEFMHKFIDNGTGTISAVNVAQTKWNATTNSRDTLLFGNFTGLSVVTEYTKETVLMENGPQFVEGENPDTLFISVVLFSTDQSSVNATEFYVDEFVLNNRPASIEDLAMENVSVYPTVSNTIVNFAFDNANDRSVQVFDLNGKMVKTMRSNTNNMVVNVSDLSSGNYFYKITDANNQYLNSGKFMVTK